MSAASTSFASRPREPPIDPFTSTDLFFAYALIWTGLWLIGIRFLDLYEREPMWAVISMFLWGAVGAAILATIGNEFVAQQLPIKEEAVFGNAIEAPVVEEISKGLALVIAFAVSWWAHRRFGLLEFEGPTDGIVYGAAVGLGFAFTEDLFYFMREAGRTGDLGEALQVYLDRRDFFGPAMLRHGIWTAAFGAGLGLATWARTWFGRIGFPLLGLSAAMLMHATNNGLIEVVLAIEYGFENAYNFIAGPGVVVDLAKQMQATSDSAYDILKLISWLYVFLFFGGIALWLYFQRRIIGRELVPEVESGLVAPEERHLATRFIERSRRYWRDVRSGRLEVARARAKLSNELADLAFAKARKNRNAKVDIGHYRARVARTKATIGALSAELGIWDLNEGGEPEMPSSGAD